MSGPLKSYVSSPRSSRNIAASTPSGTGAIFPNGTISQRRSSTELSPILRSSQRSLASPGTSNRQISSISGSLGSRSLGSRSQSASLGSPISPLGSQSAFLGSPIGPLGSQSASLRSLGTSNVPTTNISTNRQLFSSPSASPIRVSPSTNSNISSPLRVSSPLRDTGGRRRRRSRRRISSRRRYNKSKRSHNKRRVSKKQSLFKGGWWN